MDQCFLFVLFLLAFLVHLLAQLDQLGLAVLFLQPVHQDQLHQYHPYHRHLQLAHLDRWVQFLLVPLEDQWDLLGQLAQMVLVNLFHLEGHSVH